MCWKLTPFCTASIVDFEQVNVSWGGLATKQEIKYYK